MKDREIELDRQNKALTQQRDLLLATISKHLGEGKKITLREAIALIEVSAILHKQTLKDLMNK